MKSFGEQFIWVYVPAMIIALMILCALAIIVKAWGLFIGFFFSALILLSVSKSYIDVGGHNFGKED